MHRSTFLPRSLAWSLFLGFVINALGQFASAQQPPGFGQQVVAGKGGSKEAPEDPFLELPKETTKLVGMSTKELIAEVRSENPKVARVQADIENPRAVRITGVAPGVTRIFLTDVKKNTETLEVRVPYGDEEEARTKRKSLLEEVRIACPTASIDVQARRNDLSSATSTATVRSTTISPPYKWTIVLSGNVPDAQCVQVILELTRGVFGDSNVVNAMRIGGVQQVEVDVVIARVERSKMRQIGFSFLNAGKQHFVASTVGGGGSLATAATLPSVLSPAASLTSTPNAVFGIFNDKQSFLGYLEALTSEGLAKVISEPRVIALSGRPASFVSGGETPILTSSGAGAPTVTYKQFGTVINFLPIVLGNGKIHMEVRPEFSALNAANGITIPSAVGPATVVPGFDIRSAQVTVQMEDGQTLAIGGMIQNLINATNVKVPILGDLPFLGTAFSSRSFTESEEELVILVTPHLVAPMACCQLPKYLPGRETRSADDFELFLEGIMEAPHGQRNIHPYSAAYLNGPSSEKYPCGDASGQCGRCGPTGCASTCPNGACTNGSARANGGACAPATPGNRENADIRPVGNIGVPDVYPAQAPVGEAMPAAQADASPTLPNLGPPTETQFAPNPAFGQR